MLGSILQTDKIIKSFNLSYHCLSEKGVCLSNHKIVQSFLSVAYQKKGFAYQKRAFAYQCLSDSLSQPYYLLITPLRVISKDGRDKQSCVCLCCSL